VKVNEKGVSKIIGVDGSLIRSYVLSFDCPLSSFSFSYTLLNI